MALTVAAVVLVEMVVKPVVAVPIRLALVAMNVLFPQVLEEAVVPVVVLEAVSFFRDMAL